MINKVNPSRLATYQVIGTVTLFILLSAAMGGYFYQSTVKHANYRLSQLAEEMLAEQKQQLGAEINSLLRQANYDISIAANLLKTSVKQHVDGAHQIASALYNDLKNTQLPVKEQQHVIKEAFRNYRFFEGRGYIFISSLPKISILLPPTPEIEGQSVEDLIDDTGKNVTEAAIEAVTSLNHSGFVEYRWYPPGQKEEMEDKISYVKLFEPWGWIFGAGDYVYEMENTLKRQFLAQMQSTLLTNGQPVIILNKNGEVLLNHKHSLPTTIIDIPNTQNTFPNFNERVKAELFYHIQTSIRDNAFFSYKTSQRHTRPDTDIIALAQTIPHWQWIVIAGLEPNATNQLIKQQSASIKQVSEKQLQEIWLTIVIVALITLIATAIFSRWLKGLLLSYENENQEQNQRLLENAQELDLAAGVFDSVTQGILITNKDNKIVKANYAFFQFTGYTEKELYNEDPESFFDKNIPVSFNRDIFPSLESRGFWQGEILQKIRTNNTTLHCAISVTARRDDHNHVKNYIITIKDISERKKHEDQLRYLADYDSLTNLPNRRYLLRRIDALIESNHGRPEKFALVFVDLDRFKAINDSLGHATGDAVLIETAKRLCSAVRENDTVVRLGGDEFILLFSPLRNIRGIQEFCDRLKNIISHPIQYNEHRFTLTTSIGLSIYPDDGDTAESLLQNADIALYESKNKGRNTYTFFNTELAEYASSRLDTEIALRDALNNNEFELFYQPQICLKTCMVVGVEALLRWKRTGGQFVSPAVFIPLAEEINIISDITNWVMDTAAKQAVAWHDRLHMWVPIAVNLSGKDIHRDLPQRLKKVQYDNDIDPKTLVLEVTEGSIINNIDVAIETLEEVREQGYSVALDDFGTGFSSLHYLSKFPIDKLKIDKSFVDNIASSPKSAAVTAAIVQVGQCLELKIVAEGVEDLQQLQVLRAMGCNIAQGYYYSKPLPADDCLQFIEREKLANQPPSLDAM
ncbi:EAL domain-containing protein [Marinibactrum halimedae]|uniref:EAL domain-containing protein n=1 Tax=Marinibactrum halimedae TaxID=1444977 RepID=A0AA37T9K1_9GAMM|nr:EAL domain-containing protein [Marinibactrum halimedae]MCD9459226.1 EAL domain-containing protein [Marinibactrum halimedae]GLS27298.1 hypothetical protein GCM10007877_30170 [Marinibactrum halimedae]